MGSWESDFTFLRLSFLKVENYCFVNPGIVVRITIDAAYKSLGIVPVIL